MTRSAGLMNPNHYLAVAIRYLLGNRPGWPASRGDRQDARQQWHHRPRCRTICIARSGKSRSASNGLLPDYSTASAASAARKARARVSSAPNGSVWTTDKDGLILGLAGRRNHGAHRQRSRRALSRNHLPLRRVFLYANRRARYAGTKERAQETVAGGRIGDHSGGRPDHSEVDQRARQQRPHRRSESHDGQRMVRGPPLGHGRYLQTVRGKFPQPGASERNRLRSPGDRKKVRCNAGGFTAAPATPNNPAPQTNSPA